VKVLAWLAVQWRNRPWPSIIRGNSVEKTNVLIKEGKGVLKGGTQVAGGC
jgi:hypothetical protein